MSDFLTVLGQSEFAGEDMPLWYLSIAIQGCHVLIGCALAHPWVPLWFTISVFSGWVSKELFADIVNSEFSNTVLIDSAADLSFGLIGYAVVFFSRGAKS